MNAAFSIRTWTPSDTKACIDIYVDAIRNGTRGIYTPEEAAAWAPEHADHAEWTARLASGRTWIAETGSGPQGFITLAPAGHLDLFFVRPAARPLGIADALYERLLTEARAQGLPAITTHASHLARRFLEKRGWEVESEERVLRHGVWLTRFTMHLSNLSN